MSGVVRREHARAPYPLSPEIFQISDSLRVIGAYAAGVNKAGQVNERIWTRGSTSVVNSSGSENSAKGRRRHRWTPPVRP